MSCLRPCLLLVALVLLAGCGTGGALRGSTGKARRAPEHYAQSMDSATNGCLRNPGCYTQTGEDAVIPWAARAVDAARTTVVVMELLKDVDVNLGEALLRNVTVQPRYKYDAVSGRWRVLEPEQVAKWMEDHLFDLLLGTLAPDIVIHESGNPNKVQRVYDYKFPCLPSRKTRPRWRYSKEDQLDQGTRYRNALGGEERPRLITPQLGIQ